jgi:hypothetical protein
MEAMLDARTIVLRDHPRSSLIAGRKMLNSKPPLLAWIKRLMKATPTMYHP